MPPLGHNVLFEYNNFVTVKTMYSKDKSTRIQIEMILNK